MWEVAGGGEVRIEKGEPAWEFPNVFFLSLLQMPADGAKGNFPGRQRPPLRYIEKGVCNVWEDSRFGSDKQAQQCLYSCGITIRVPTDLSVYFSSLDTSTSSSIHKYFSMRRFVSLASSMCNRYQLSPTC